MIRILICIGLLTSILGVSQENVKPFFRNGESQKVSGFGDRKNWVKHELWVETEFDSDKDGKLDRMHVMVTRPLQTDRYGLKLPVIYVSSPYFSGIAKKRKKYYWDPFIELGAIPKLHKHPSVRQKSRRNLQMFSYDIQWVPRGYIMVYSSSPGTGLSDGSPTIGGSNETLAPKAVIDWLCGRAKGYLNRVGSEEVKAYWSSGKVGMIGASYNGTLALAAATTGVQGLEAIIPIAPVTSWYNYYRSNGLVRSPGGYIGEDMDVLFDGIHSGDKKIRASNCHLVRDSILVPGQDRLSGDYNEFWESRNYINQMDNMKAAMLMVHSFDDWNVMPDHSYNAYKTAKKMGLPVKLYFGQGGHGVPPPFELMNLWFTKYLHGVDNGIEKSVEVLIERPGYRSAIGYTSFPDEKTETVPMYFSPSMNGGSSLSIFNSEIPAFESFIDDHHFSAEDLILTRTSSNRLLYLTSELQEELRISGSPSLLVNIKLNSSKGNISVYLLAVKELEGGKRSYSILTRGWADPQNYRSLSKSEALDSNAFYPVEFDLVPTDQIVEAGQKMGVLIFSSDKNFTLCPKPGTKFTVNLTDSHIKIPIVGGKEAYVKAMKEAIE